jgi:hypothetical protein
MAMRRVLVVWLAALLVAGCGSFGLSVPLRTATGPGPLPEGSCYLSYGGGDFIEHPTYGVAVANENGIYELEWPIGFTARRSGGNIEVLDTKGTVVAVTGRKIRIDGSSWGPPPGPVRVDNSVCVLQGDQAVGID